MLTSLQYISVNLNVKLQIVGRIIREEIRKNTGNVKGRMDEQTYIADPFYMVTEDDLKIISWQDILVLLQMLPRFPDRLQLAEQLAYGRLHRILGDGFAENRLDGLGQTIVGLAQNPLHQLLLNIQEYIPRFEVLASFFNIFHNVPFFKYKRIHVKNSHEL